MDKLRKLCYNEVLYFSLIGLKGLSGYTDQFDFTLSINKIVQYNKVYNH